MANTHQHYRQIARLHMEGIRHGFLSTLGEEFLALLYNCIDKDPETVLLTEVKNNRVIGFVSGARSLKPIYRRMLLKLPQLIIALGPVLLKPKKIFQILELIKHSFSSSDSTTRGKPLPTFELLSIAVTESQRRSGVAYRLYDRLKEYSTEHNIKAFKIVVGENLKSAHRFYLQMGALPVGEIYIHNNEKSLIYVQSV